MIMECITTFGFLSTADEVAEGIDLSGKQVVITGEASGIGLEMARTLAHVGAEVTLAVRKTDARKQAATGGGHFCLIGCIATPSGREWTILRGLQRGSRGDEWQWLREWRGTLCSQFREC
jgi:hypothetical protein